MTPSRFPDAPVRASPPRDWPHLPLFERVRTTLLALPAHFRTEIRISGISATDLFTLNSAIGAAIEEQVVEALNGARRTWDPNADYTAYSFERQPQTFPDVPG